MPPSKKTTKKKPTPTKREAAPKPKRAKKPAAKAAVVAAPTDAARDYVVEVARLLHDDKCTDVAVLDVRNLSQVTNYIVIGSGTSDRQMRSVLQHVEDLGKKRGFPAWKSDADEQGKWLLLDSVDVVVHLFEPNTRAHYDLEMLWGDAPRIAWERPEQLNRDRAGLHA